MPTIEILPFGTGVGANVQTQAAFAAAASTPAGFAAGIAPSANLNKVWRQSSFIAAGIAGWLGSQGLDVLDNGDLAGLTAKMVAHIASVTDLAAATGAAKVGTTKEASVQAQLDILYIGAVNVRSSQFAGGAKGDGITDDKAAMNLAHATGRLVYYPEGTYLFSPGVTMASGGILGDGPERSILKSTDVTAADLISYTGNYATQTNRPKFADFQLLGVTGKALGAGLSVAPVTGEASYLNFSNVTFQNLPVCLNFVAASLWKIIGCNFLGYNTAGVQVANTNNADSGDSSISGGCVFSTPFAAGVGVIHFSSGGLKIIGNKFLGGTNAYAMRYNSLVKSTSVLIISANSMENMTGPGVSLSRIAGTFSYSNINITGGNEFGVGPRGIQTDGTAGFLSQLNATGNIFNISGVAGATCVELNAVTDFLVGSNTMRGNGGGSSTGVYIAATCTNGKVDINNYSNLTTTVNNLSTSTAVTQNSQSASSTTLTTGWGGYGTLFISAAVNVVFPTPFTVTPSITDVTIMPGSSNGVIGGFLTAISKTGFTYQAISCVTGIAATIYWKASGII